MKIEKLRQKRRTRVLFCVIAAALIIGAFGVMYARYSSFWSLKSSAELTTYDVSVTDFTTKQEVSWELQLPAATRLYEDSQFDYAAVIKHLKITNNSEEALDISISVSQAEDFHGEISGENEGDAEDEVYISILSRTSLGSYESWAECIQDALSNNEEMSLGEKIAAANEAVSLTISGTLEVGESASKYITVVVWRENSADELSDESISIDLEKHLALVCTVSEE